MAQPGKLKDILIIGASGHAKVIIDIIEKQKKYKIFGFIDTHKDVGEIIFGYTVLGTEMDIPLLMNQKNIHGGIIAIGDNWVRKQMKDKILSICKEFKFVSAIHPKSILFKGIKIPTGVVIMAGVIVNANAQIGDFCILNTKASLGHDSVMQNFSSLAPGVTAGGCLEIGECSAISIGAIVIQNIKIGAYTIVGAGSLVVKDIGSYKVAFGNPAKEIRTRKPEEKYLNKVGYNDHEPLSN